MNGKYLYDKENFKFKTQKRSLRSVFMLLVKYFVASISLAILYYIVFALLFSTDRERRIRSENRMYSRLYPEMEEKQRLLEDVVSGLEAKDNVIYNNLFSADVVSFDKQLTTDFLADNDSLEVEEIVHYTEKRFKVLQSAAKGVDEDFMAIFKALSEDGVELPPLSAPIEKFSYNSVGASVGDKINPFYKVKVRHDGLDMVVPAGTSVVATADGVVKSVVRSKKGLGNVVEIMHPSGYITRYAHLSDIKVLSGRKVNRGAVIGKVGVSGNSFVPHLHYEVRKDSLVLDPVNYFFSSVEPEEYGYMLLLSASAGQSMD